MPCPASICRRHAALAALLLPLVLPGAGRAQSACTSDGQNAPTRLVERFISADCEGCWGQDDAPAGDALVLDWIVPGALEDDAPLSAAALREGLQRLQALGAARPGADAPVQLAHGRHAPQGRLRVALGPAFNDYVGVSIRFWPARAGRRPGQTWTGWLALVETIPAGTDGTPVTRNLVRNLLESAWGGAGQLSKTKQWAWYENRVMSIAPQARVERLRVVGWVQDARGRIVSMAQSVCQDAPQPRANP